MSNNNFLQGEEEMATVSGNSGNCFEIQSQIVDGSVVNISNLSEPIPIKVPGHLVKSLGSDLVKGPRSLLDIAASVALSSNVKVFDMKTAVEGQTRLDLVKTFIVSKITRLNEAIGNLRVFNSVSDEDL